jgi:hypothetical protein
VGGLPAVHAGPPAGPARARLAVLGCRRREAARGGGLRAPTHRAAALYGALHGRHELPADARGRAGDGGSQRLRADRARHRHDHAQPRGGAHLPVAGPVPLAGRHVVRARSQHPLVPRASHLPPGRGERGGAPARRPCPADRPRGARPVGVLLRLRTRPVALDPADHRAGTATGQGARRVQPDHPACRAAPQLGCRPLSRRQPAAGPARLAVPGTSGGSPACPDSPGAPSAGGG